MLKVLVVDEPGHFRDGVVQNLAETGLNVSAVSTLDEVPREATGDTIVVMWGTDFQRAREFVVMKRLLAVNESLRMIVMADQPNRILLDAAYNNGARALILMTTPTVLMRGTIELVAAGGVAFPVYPLTAMDMTKAGFPVEAVKERLTAQQLRMVMHLASDLTNAQIATALGVALPTVKKHLKDIHIRLGASSRAGIVAICAGLKPPGVPAPRDTKRAA